VLIGEPLAKLRQRPPWASGQASAGDAKRQREPTTGRDDCLGRVRVCGHPVAACDA